MASRHLTVDGLEPLCGARAGREPMWIFELRSPATCTYCRRKVTPELFLGWAEIGGGAALKGIEAELPYFLTNAEEEAPATMLWLKVCEALAKHDGNPVAYALRRKIAPGAARAARKVYDNWEEQAAKFKARADDAWRRIQALN